MVYQVFLSYTRANNDAYLKQFVEDLSVVIREKRGDQPGDRVIFFDQQDLELGEDWDNSIVEALQTVKVVVAIYSPAYFKSDYCGKEWTLFRQRLAAASSGGVIPPLLKPIIWVPFNDNPPAVAEGQYTFGDPQGLHNVRGVKYVLKQLQEYRTQYNDLIEDLANEIVAAVKPGKYTVPALPSVPALKDVVSAFSAQPAPGAPAAVAVTPTGPKHVRLVYLASAPQAFGAARASDPYLDSGAGDWKPFYPTNTTRVHRFVQSVVASDELDFTSEEMEFGPNLIAEIEDAWRRRHIVVLIVDGWSVNFDAQYRAMLSQLDQRLDYHWCVLVPWNDADKDAVAMRSQIEATMNQTFYRHANLVHNPMFYRDNIGTADDLKLALKQVLMLLKEEIKKRAQVEKPMPAGPSRVVMTGPSTEK